MGDKQRCETCRWWRPLKQFKDGTRVGRCKRPDGQFHGWPKMNDSDCGEWEPRDAE